MRTAHATSLTLVALLSVGCAVQEHHAAGHERHGPGTQTANLFVGGSSEPGDLEGLTAGVDWEYRIAPRIGVGVFIESVTGQDRSLALGAQATIHATEHVLFFGGLGLERNHHEWGAIGRIGAGYEFPIENDLILTPTIAYDFSEHDDLIVYGVSIGMVF